MAQQNRYTQFILNKTLPTILSIATATLIVLSSGIWWMVDRNMQDRHQERVEAVIESFDAAVSMELEHVQAIANTPLITQAIDDPNGLSRFYLNSYLASVDINRSFQTAISAYHSDGRLFSTNRTLNVRYYNPVTDEPWFVQVVSHQKPAVSVSVEGIIAAAPIIIDDQMRGVVISELNHLGPWFSFSFDEAAVLILDEQNNILYSSNEQWFPPLNTLSSVLNPRWRSVKSASHDGFTILSLEDRSLLSRELGEFYFFLLLATAVIFVSGIICASVAGSISERIIGEFIRSVEHLEKHQELGALNHQVFGIKEIQHLRTKFQKLLNNLVASNLSKERVSALMNSLNDLLVVFDLDGNPILSNKAFDDFFTDKEFVNPDIMSFLFQNEEDPLDLLNMNVSLEPFEREYTSGIFVQKRFIVNWKRNPLNDEQGRVIGAIFVGQDVTESSELTTENKLKEAAIDGADSGVMILETDINTARIRYTNSSFHKLTGIRKELLANRDINLYDSRLFPEDSLVRIKKAIEQNQSTIEIINIRFIHGINGHIEFNFSPIPVHSSARTHFYLCILKDVTQQQMTSKLLIDAKKRAEESAQLKSAFLASMSHEIRTPMNGVTGMLGILSDTPLTAEQLNYVRIAQGSAESLLHIINDILDFSKLEAGKASIESVDFNLCEMLENFIDSMAHLAHNKGLELVLDMSQLEHCMIMGDPGRLRQILTNLVGNAIKFTQQGDILVKAELHRSTPITTRLEITVTDSGRGIPKEYQQTLFEPFTQVDSKSNESIKGTGLGLAIVKQLVENMKGHISLRSEPGKGSSFNFYVQVKPSKLVAPLIESHNLQSKKVLLVDDNTLSRNIICKLLKHWGIQIVSFESGSDALSFMQQQAENEFDGAIIDSDMPGMSGMELGRKLKGLDKTNSLPMLLMTSFRNQPASKAIKRAGFSGYFSKPVKAHNLADALNLLWNKEEASTRVITDKLIHQLRQDSAFSRSYRVLLVEDNLVNQMISKKFIESLGLTTVIKADGQQAIDALKNDTETFDLVVMDCQMPVIDGFEAARLIRRGDAGDKYKDIIIIAMTANVLEEDKERCIQAGMSDYLPKPLRREQLAKTLKNWLE
ncbi:response regulator [Reinekea marinisedimentorum]|uniref:Sensory/regulatory protein RpfC n=1 Tax=Reinekea marinisedimentorum TaxID=230495 RepID=A0A4R3ICW2_9GAMM|nr:response regulator [Reinekea marinisedimentorum]TCS43257.1 PAS domain S-box-containing protein [Reinekea marinisedimentorum]